MSDILPISSRVTEALQSPHSILDGGQPILRAHGACVDLGQKHC